MKSKIVNRKNLKPFGRKLRLTDFIQNGSHGSLGENINGNLFEAFRLYIWILIMNICKEIVRKIFLKRNKKN